MLCPALIWLDASPFVVGAVVARWRPANRFVSAGERTRMVLSW